MEVLVAFTIMAFALGALYQSMGMSVRTLQRVESQSRAAVVASSVLSLYVLAPREGINQQGTSPDGFHWSAMSQPYAPQMTAAPVRKLQELKVDVSWTEGAAQGAFSVLTLIPEVAE